MRLLSGMGLDAAIAGLALALPFYLLNRHCFHNPRQTLWYFLLSLYLCAMFSLVGLPDIRYIRFDPRINLVPFRYFFTDRSSWPNVILFVPLGFLLPLLWLHFSKPSAVVLFGFCTSLFIELLQIFTFRATDINDLITNTLGAFLGWCLAREVLRCFPGIRPAQTTHHVYLLCLISVGFMVLLHPVLADPVWKLLMD